MTKHDYRKFRVFIKNITTLPAPDQEFIELYRQEMYERSGRNSPQPPRQIQERRASPSGIHHQQSDSSSQQTGEI